MPTAAWADTPRELEFDKDLMKAASDEQAIGNAREYKELALYFPDLGLERAPLKTPPSETKISSRAENLIIFLEVSGKTQYESKYNRPVWPKGSSGVTIGIGYDIGYTSQTELSADWKDYLNSDLLSKLGVACGKKGPDAAAVVSMLKNIYVDWDAAKKQFDDITLKRYVGLAESALPNFDQLSLNSRGALVSLVYNRGATFNVPLDHPNSARYDEMRQIKKLMVSSNYSEIPDQIRKMKRLWLGNKDLRGVVQRRELEASLFELGLGS
jgi:GH24 family phage-related lysozyme (muramidase)